MRIGLAIGFCLLAACSARAQSLAPAAVTYGPSSPAGQQASQPAPSGIHAAVVRIVAPGQGSVSYGSGTLIFADDTRGVVITNWHVINEATGQISVHFPDGFYSLGTVQGVDRDWDLAAILIRKPNAKPVPVAEQPPFPGEMLMIAGYGSGEYRAATGRCTQYVAPGLEFPFEMVEVAVSARQGDSGGPIFNSRGELAGVLFGEGNGRTSGSYCGRVRWFLSSIVPRLPSEGPMIAQAPQPRGPQAKGPLERLPSRPGMVGSQIQSLQPVEGTVAATTSVPVAPPASGPQQAWQSISPTPEQSHVPVVASTRSSSEAEVVQIGWEDVAGETLGEQAKTVMAGIGVLAILFHVLRWLSRGEATA